MDAAFNSAQIMFFQQIGALNNENRKLQFELRTASDDRDTLMEEVRRLESENADVKKEAEANVSALEKQCTKHLNALSASEAQS